MKHKLNFANVALIAVTLLGVAFGTPAMAQEGTGATPTPDLHYLDQAVPGGVPLDATPVSVVTQEAAPVDVTPQAEVAIDVTPDSVAPEGELPQNIALPAAPCQVGGPIPCNLLYIPVMIRGVEGAPNEASALSWHATVVAYATRKAPTPTPQPQPTATKTKPAPTATRPVATATAPAATAPAATAPVATATKPAATSVPAAPTATMMPMPMPTTAPGTGCLNCVDPKAIVPVPNPAPNVSGQMCPVWAHDLWVVTGPNGKLYRTWHPPTQPAGMAGAGCNFDHSHGTKRDPRQSAADNTLPAYGYDADIDGMAEPHAGFKTEWANKGDCNNAEGFCATSDTKVTVHMGTAGAGRVTQEMHTFIFDMIGNKGSIVHVRGMASTGDALTQCDPAPDTSTERGFRLLAMPKDQAEACDIHSPYEVWQFHLTVGDNIINSKFANFDGITVARRQANGTFVLEPTSKTWPNAPFSGCEHDVYFGGFILNSNVDGLDAKGVRQYIKIGSDGGRPILDTVGKNTYKRPFDGCGPVNYTVN